MKRQRQPPSYYQAILDQHTIEYDELDRQIRQALKLLAGMSLSEVKNLEMLLKPKTDRIGVLKREMAACKRELVQR